MSTRSSSLWPQIEIALILVVTFSVGCAVICFLAIGADALAEWLEVSTGVVLVGVVLVWFAIGGSWNLISDAVRAARRRREGAATAQVHAPLSSAPPLKTVEPLPTSAVFAVFSGHVAPTAAPARCRSGASTWPRTNDGSTSSAPQGALAALWIADVCIYRQGEVILREELDRRMNHAFDSAMQEALDLSCERLEWSEEWARGEVETTEAYVQGKDPALNIALATIRDALLGRAGGGSVSNCGYVMKPILDEHPDLKAAWESAHAESARRAERQHAAREVAQPAVVTTADWRFHPGAAHED